MTTERRLDDLASALEAERQALVGHDVDGLVRANEAKLAALRALENAPLGEVARERLAALSELNRANGALLARRRREVGWALRQLGRSESQPAYDARGRAGSTPRHRHFGAI